VVMANALGVWRSLLASIRSAWLSVHLLVDQRLALFLSGPRYIDRRDILWPKLDFRRAVCQMSAIEWRLDGSGVANLWPTASPCGNPNLYSVLLRLGLWPEHV